MKKDDLRQYHRDLALHCLTGPNRDCPAMTAGELCDQMQTLAAFEQHPRACYADLRPGAVSGILTALERQHLARRSGERHNGRHGRPEPLWILAPLEAMPDQTLPRMPVPPDEDAPTAVAIVAPECPAPPFSGHDYSSLGQPQLVAVAQAQDILLQALAHFAVDPRRSLVHLEPARAQAREILRAAGLEAGA